MNIVLIGMPGSGKSTVGVVLAKTLNMSFCDTDILIQENDGRKLQQIIDTDGIDTFLKIEEESIINKKIEDCVVATGGSVVLSKNAVEHFKKDSILVYLKVSYYDIKKRIHNLNTRGIAFKKGQTLKDIYDERCPLYEKYADITVKSGRGKIIDVVERIKSKLDFSWHFFHIMISLLL